jgi:hypothetical protein
MTNAAADRGLLVHAAASMADLAASVRRGEFR